MQRAIAFGLSMVLAGASAANSPPAAPAIHEPVTEGLIVNPSDVHMEAGPFSDPDVGDQHLCTDWEIWTVAPLERVWFTSCIGGVERVHTHLGDGTFENSHAGRTQLLHSTSYTMRVRFRDDSADPPTEWGAYSERGFVTAAPEAILPMVLDDVRTSPVPTWRLENGSFVILPNGVSMTLENKLDEDLLAYTGTLGGNSVVNSGELNLLHPVRVVVSSPAAFTLGESTIRFADGAGAARAIYLPAVTHASAGTTVVWVSAVGATYAGSLGQSEPDFTTILRTGPVPWLVPPGYVVDVFAGGFTLPVSIAFVPSPGPSPNDIVFYVGELYGQIKTVRRNGQVSTYASGLLNFNPTGVFPGSGEQGLGSVCVDPSNGDLYATIVYSSDPQNEPADHYSHVKRFTSADGGYTAATQTVILDMPFERMGQSHFISNISFGPDDKLYVHVGDGFDNSAGVDINSFRGKILRINRDGTPLPDNPLYNLANGFNSQEYIWVYGHRNHFGGAWRASNNGHYSVENGPTRDRFSRAIAGRNFGYDGSNASMNNFAIWNWEPAHAPINIAFIQPETFGGSGFPSGLFDQAFVTESGPTYGTGPQSLGKRITRFILDNNETRIAGPIDFAVYAGSGQATCAALAAGPDGLYFSTLYKDFGALYATDPGAEILRIRYVGATAFDDCNSNNVPDSQDIAATTSQDCNQNGVPDECDVAALVARDCNNNAVPDECEVVNADLTHFDFANAGEFYFAGSSEPLFHFCQLSRLPGATGSVVRPPFSNQPVQRFTASFDFRLIQGVGGKGFCFALLDSSVYPNVTLFDQNGPGASSLVVSFPTSDGSPDMVKVLLNGVEIASYQSTFDFSDQLIHHVYISFAQKRLTVRLTQPSGAYETAFDELLISGYTPFVARWGFGGSSAAVDPVRNDIDNATYYLSNALDANKDGLLDSCGCVADVDDGTGTGQFDGGVTIDDLIYYLVLFEAGDPRADVDNGSGQGIEDSGVTIDDLLYFLMEFEAGC